MNETIHPVFSVTRAQRRLGLAIGLVLAVGLYAPHPLIGIDVVESVGLSSKSSHWKSAGGKTLLLQVNSLIQS